MKIELAGQSDRRVTYRIDGHEVSIEAAVGSLRAGGDAELALGLLPALRQQQPLVLDLPLPNRLTAALPRLQQVFADWFSVAPVAVSTTSDVPEPATSSPGPVPASPRVRTGCFFSGGVDSFFSVLQGIDEIDALVFVHGFDIGADDTELGALAARHAREAATALGKPLIEVRTDLRSFGPIDVDWEFTHGAAMSLVAQTLGAHLDRMLVPSSFTNDDAIPWGSNPLTDALWSGTVELVHDGAEVARFEKMVYLADQDVATAHLRVCWENRGGRFNCGQCEKCVRTMIAARALGAADRFATFDRPLDMWRLRVGALRGQPLVDFTRAALHEASRRGDAELVWALRARLLIGPRRQAARELRHRLLNRHGRS